MKRIPIARQRASAVIVPLPRARKSVNKFSNSLFFVETGEVCVRLAAGLISVKSNERETVTRLRRDASAAFLIRNSRSCFVEKKKSEITTEVE